MFRRIHFDEKKGTVIRVKRREIKNNSRGESSDKKEELTCKVCGFVAKSKLGLIAHSRKHKK